MRAAWPEPPGLGGRGGPGSGAVDASGVTTPGTISGDHSRALFGSCIRRKTWSSVGRVLFDDTRTWQLRKSSGARCPATAHPARDS